jgi:hypothetical protein
MYGISRIDSRKSHTYAWKVTITRRRATFIKYFTDGVYGNKSKSLAAARAYREQIITQHPPMPLKEFCAIVKTSNHSGVSGVCRTSVLRKGGKLYCYWVGSWSPQPRKTRQHKFAIDKYGEEEAFKRAVRARKKALKQMEGYFNPGMSRTNV